MNRGRKQYFGHIEFVSILILCSVFKSQFHTIRCLLTWQFSANSIFACNINDNQGKVNIDIGEKDQSSLNLTSVFLKQILSFH